MRLSRWIRAIGSIGSIAWLGGACGGEAPERSCDPLRGPVFSHFANATAASGVEFRYATYDFKGGGLAVADLDGDGLPEIVAGSRLGGLALFHNRGKLRFERVADAGLDAGLEVTALAAIDLDNDGDRDLVVAGAGVGRVMANQGDGTFVEAARFEDSGRTEHVLPVDLDGDGRLDLYFGNYELRTGGGTIDRLYMNRGGLQFAAGVLVGAGMTWTTSAFDFDGDGDLDLYVANDTLLADFGRPGPPPTSALHPDLLLRNDGPGPDGVPRLTDIAAALGDTMTTPRSSMGGLLADLDDDGQLDLYIPNYGAKKLLVRDATGGYVERATELGVDGIARFNADCPPDTDDEHCLLLSWSAALSDFDLDGYDELLVVNGETVLGKPPPVLMFARGPDLPYHEVSPDIDCIDARGLVATDLDGDGDQDLVMGVKDGPLTLYETVGRPAADRWLRVELRGQVSNREGVGAVVTARLASGRSVMRTVAASGVIHSSTPAEVLFGLGDDALQALDIRWPSGRRTEVTGPVSGAIVVDEN